MSNPTTLFAKIKMEQSKFEDFLNSRPELPELSPDWLEWLESRAVFDKAKLTPAKVFYYYDPTSDFINRDWVNATHSLTFSDYNPETEIWHFGMLMFRENYSEMIPNLEFLKSASKFKDENSNDFAIVLNLLGDDTTVYAYLKYQNNEALFDSKIKQLSDVHPDVLHYTELYLAKKIEEFANE